MAGAPDVESGISPLTFTVAVTAPPYSLNNGNKVSQAKI
ncbi:unnamed protein product [Gongylonema pulchrum]|uniref:Peroxiredoxin n=1 Tax=Gongylonema pulchrum TaxID=637853 RepID=A0A183DM44_9BILA|nr:unnamed protein product [Gongylonema pulchrum]